MSVQLVSVQFGTIWVFLTIFATTHWDLCPFSVRLPLKLPRCNRRDGIYTRVNLPRPTAAQVSTRARNPVILEEVLQPSVLHTQCFTIIWCVPLLEKQVLSFMLPSFSIHPQLRMMRVISLAPIVWYVFLQTIDFLGSPSSPISKCSISWFFWSQSTSSDVVLLNGSPHLLS